MPSNAVLYTAVASSTLRSPAVRVSAARDMLDLVDRFEPGARTRVRSLLPSASLEALDASARTSWMPVLHHHWVVDGICEVLGPERAVRCWRESVSELLERPLLRNFFKGMIRVFGARPGSRVSVFVKGWPLAYRDCCTLRIHDETESGLTLVFDDIAPEVRAFPNYFHSFRGLCEGFAQTTQIPGTVDFHPLPGARRAEARFVFTTSTK